MPAGGGEAVRRACAALLVLLIVGPLPARASEPELFGLGARSGAMAGSGAADAEGYDAAFANPAGLVGPTRRRLTVGYVLARYRLALLGAHRHVDPTDGIVLGADLPLPFGGALASTLALGVAFYLPVGVINRARDGFPDQPRLALLEQRTQVISVLAGLGARVHPRVSVGIGVLALAALVGGIAIAPDPAGRIGSVSEEQLVVSYAPVVGVRLQATAALKLGATFHGESKSRYDLAVKTSLGVALPITLPTLRIAGTAQFDPMQLTLEAALRARRWLTLDVGATWKHWSAYPNPVDNATAGAPPLPPTGYHDTLVPRAALEATLASGALRLCGRAGYFFEWSPAPRPSATLIDADRHVLTGGAGLEWQNRFTTLLLDLFAQWHHLDGAQAGGDFGVFGFTVGVDL